jgi:hypothetical protein
MAVLDSIAIEVQATIVGVLILLIITVLEIIDLQRAKKLHRQKGVAIASSRAIPTQKERLVSPFSLILQFIFGFTAFVLFALWMMYLIIREMPILAAVSGVSAFIGIMMPFIVWSASRKASRKTVESVRNAEQRRQETARQPTVPKTPVTQTPSTQTVKETISVVDAPAVKEPVQPAKPQPLTEPEPAIKTEVKPAAHPKPDPAHVFPQDSMLRRHFITHLAASVNPSKPGRPSDSMLRRHYDTMLAAEETARFAQPAAAPATVSTKTSRTYVHPVKLPEDSMLRRHFLTALQAKTESSLSLPARPTDSMLRRHFDMLKENLIAAELAKHLDR